MVGVSGVVSEAGGDACVGAVGESDEADREVAEGGHDLWGVAGVEVVTVFVVGDVSDPVEGFDTPVALEPGRDLGGMGLADGEGTQQIHRLGGAGRVALAGASGAGSFHLRDLGETGEGDPGRGGDDLDPAVDTSAMATVTPRQGRDVLPGQRFQRLEKTGLVSLDHHQIREGVRWFV